MDDVLVKVEGVSKKYCTDLKKSLYYGLHDIAGEAFGYIGKNTSLRDKEFWALKDVSFSLKRGDCLGLIGKNGAGKSTLLKLLAGIVKPDKGKITIRGEVGSLIELGAGFNPVLTGKENIYINGAIFGMPKKVINERLDSIVSFSEIEDFLDMPVQNYSSGMKVRLGFAIATQMQPDVLIIDEVLAVGDIGFRSKCYNYIAKTLRNTVVIIVSHSIPQIARYCNKVLLLSDGKVKKYGIPAECIDEYHKLFNNETSLLFFEKGCRLNSFTISDINNKETNNIEYNSLLRVKINATIDKAEMSPNITIAFHDRELQVIATCESKVGQINNNNGSVIVSVDISPILLKSGNYKLSLIIFDKNNHKHLVWCNAAWDLYVHGTTHHYGGAAICHKGIWSQY